jgi:hypothetical protein
LQSALRVKTTSSPSAKKLVRNQGSVPYNPPLQNLVAGKKAWSESIIVEIENIPLAKLMQSWKRFIARESNKILGREGTFWQREYWDTYMRDAAQTLKAIKYIENNPVKAKLVRETKDWPWSSARFRDRYGKLVPQRSAGL